MRMWMLPTQCMCGRHRSGEHNEISKHLPDLYAGKSIHGRMTPIVQVQLNALQRRHDELAATLNHNSPLWVDEYLIWRNYPQYYGLVVDLEYNALDLSDRCPACKELLIKGGLIGKDWGCASKMRNSLTVAITAKEVEALAHPQTNYHPGPAWTPGASRGRTDQNR